MLHLLLFALPLVVPQTPAQLLINATELFVPHMRGFEIRLHAFLFHLRLRHIILQPPHYLLKLAMGLMFYIGPTMGAKCSVRLTWDVFVRDLDRQVGTPSHWLPVDSCKEGQKGALAAVCTPTLKSARKKHQKLCTSVSEHRVWHSEGG